MMIYLTALATGAMFGAGLVVSGMTDPANIQGFLDVAGAWRPHLASGDDGRHCGCAAVFPVGAAAVE